MAVIDTDDGAKRLAKLIVQDISLYNAEKIKEGLQNDNVFEVIEAELNEGRSLYESRVSPDILSKSNYFERAINDFLIKDVLMRSGGELETNLM